MDVVVIETIKSKTFFKHLLSVADIQKELIGDKNISNSYIAIHDEIFSKQLKVFINKETGLIHLSYTHISANFSKDIVFESFSISSTSEIWESKFKSSLTNSSYRNLF